MFTRAYRYRKRRVPGLKTLSAIVNWIWPAERCENCLTVYSITRPGDMTAKNLDHIHRSSDGRFVVSDRSGIEVRPSSIASSNASESDDGGFLPRRASSMRTSWRRPLVSYPSELSFLPPPTPHMQRSNARYSNGLLQIDNGVSSQRLLQTVPVEFHSQPIEYEDHRPTYENLQPRSSVRRSAILSPHTPSRTSRIVSSSPASSSLIDNSTIWSPQAMYFSDLSSVQQPSSAERSFPTPQSNISQLRYLQERYSQELPSLRAIHEETRRMAQGFVPLQIQLHSPSIRYPYYPPYSSQSSANQTSPQIHHHHHHHHPQHHSHHIQPIVHQRQRTRLLPRHVRMARSAPELGSPLSDLNIRINTIEASPESRSSSSGFGSKNTSAQQNQSSRSGSTNEWRYLPPYRPPPPPQYHSQQQQYYHYQSQPQPSSSTTGTPQITPPYTMEHWLEIITRLNAASEQVNVPKAVDVGSVDGHYEWDPASPTPTVSTPTGTRDDQYIDTTTATIHLSMPASTTSLLHTQSLQPYQRKRVSKYDNIEARVQAMKEEFHAYKQRQAMRGVGVELESAC